MDKLRICLKYLALTLLLLLLMILLIRSGIYAWRVVNELNLSLEVPQTSRKQVCAADTQQLGQAEEYWYNYQRLGVRCEVK